MTREELIQFVEDSIKLFKESAVKLDEQGMYEEASYDFGCLATHKVILNKLREGKW
jgi:hypothetical protein